MLPPRHSFKYCFKMRSHSQTDDSVDSPRFRLPFESFYVIVFKANKFFSITSGSEGSGYITVKQSPDVDLLTRDRYINFYVMARDGGRPSKSAEVSVTVIVKDVNNKQPQLSVVYLNPDPMKMAGVVKENKKSAEIAKVEVVDTDTGPGGQVRMHLRASPVRLHV